jgi:hypothetical protein
VPYKCRDQFNRISTRVAGAPQVSFEECGGQFPTKRVVNFGSKRAARATRPELTVARDLVRRSQLSQVLNEARALAQFADKIVIVPKAMSLADELEEVIPSEFILGYSVPTKYGGTPIPPSCFRRPVHLLGGRPDRQRSLACQMNVVSFDCNRFTLDATFGDFFDGKRFRPHPIGGYERCLRDSLASINRMWKDYAGFTSRQAA